MSNAVAQDSFYAEDTAALVMVILRSWAARDIETAVAACSALQSLSHGHSSNQQVYTIIK